VPVGAGGAGNWAGLNGASWLAIAERRPREGCPDCVDVELAAGPFTFCTRPRTWDESLAECALHGGTLATPASVVEHDEILATALGLAWSRWWIGANDRAVEDDWVERAPTP
jgi:hypothetical protein